ncbi:MAG: PEGA domain-containing protein [Lachnospiraceae bacterium]
MDRIQRQKQKKKKRNKFLAGIVAGICFVLLSACQPAAGNADQQVAADTGFIPARSGNYDSRDTAIVISRDTEAMTITFKNMELGKYYTLNYDGATAYYDKYGQAMSLEQVRDGEIVSVDFLHRAKRLDSLHLSDGVFSFENVEQFVMQSGSRTIQLNNELYTIASDAVVLTKNGLGDRMDINAADVLRVTGFDHTIESIVIERGHGYLRLANDSYFIGGFLEVDHSRIYQISEEMLIPVPEGTYEVTVSNAGCSGTETITIAQDEEYEWDVSAWQGEAKFGTLVFTVEPSSARVYVDGRSVDTSEELQLSYGIHQMVVTANGYQTISKYIKVNEEFANMDITMEWASGDQETASGNNVSSNQTVSENQVSDNTASGNSVSGNSVSDNSVSGNEVSGNSVSGNTVSGNNASGNTATGNTPTGGSAGTNDSAQAPDSSTPVSTSGYLVNIEGPEGVEVYKDGTYIGLAPVSFPKEEGSYVIILRKDGYQTRSYTISVDDSDKDISYSFSSLVPIS